MAEAVAEAETLEFTPTWIVAAVCSLIVLISLLAERCLHYLGKVTTHRIERLLQLQPPFRISLPLPLLYPPYVRTSCCPLLAWSDG